MKKFCFLIIILILILVPVFSVFSQTNSIFSPFVSRIKVKAAESSVNISWKDTTDVKGECIIYRSRNTITAENLADADKIARVPQGVGFFEDYPPRIDTDYYYLILMEDDQSILHQMFIPFRNLSPRPVSITSISEKTVPSLITDINAEIDGDSIALSFKSSNPASQLLIYRDTEVISSGGSLASSNLIATIKGSASSYKDYPVPGLGYYYAVLDSEQVKNSSFDLKIGDNSTDAPVELEIRTTERIGLPEMPATRPRPLPYLSLNRGFHSGRPLSPSIIELIPDEEKISETSEENIRKLVENLDSAKSGSLMPVILKSESEAASGTERSMLFRALGNDFIYGNYNKVAERLTEFQKIRRSDDVEAAVHFYRGQVNYFLGNNKEAFTDFLLAEEVLYLETRPWLAELYIKLR